MSLISAERTITAGPPVEIDCPACHARQVSAIPSLYEERPVLLHLIPLVASRHIFIRCSACGSHLLVQARDLEELDDLSPDELAGQLRPYVSGVGRFLVVVALILFWFPFLAPAMAIGGFVMNRRHRGWRRAAIVAIALTFLFAGFVATLILLAQRP